MKGERKREGVKDMQKATNLIFHLFDTHRRTVLSVVYEQLKRLIGFDVYAKYMKNYSVMVQHLSYFCSIRLTGLRDDEKVILFVEMLLRS